MFHFFVDGLKRKDVTILGAQRAVKCAERTILSAKIGVINVSVNVEGAIRLRMKPPAYLIRSASKFHEIGTAEQGHAVLKGESRALNGLCQNTLDHLH